MKKIISALLVLMMVAVLAGCGAEDNSKKSDFGAVTDNKKASDDEIDVDLTRLSSTMVYSEVYNMMMEPDSFIGKTVKMKGQFALYQVVDENGEVIDGQIYYACIIADATACCQQGLEFVLAGDFIYPDDYPELGTEITVIGEFQTYMEGPDKYCHLVNAEFVD